MALAAFCAATDNHASDKHVTSCLEGTTSSSRHLWSTTVFIGGETVFDLLSNNHKSDLLITQHMCGAAVLA